MAVPISPAIFRNGNVAYYCPLSILGNGHIQGHMKDLFNGGSFYMGFNKRFLLTNRPPP